MRAAISSSSSYAPGGMEMGTAAGAPVRLGVRVAALAATP